MKKILSSIILATVAGSALASTSIVENDNVNANKSFLNLKESEGCKVITRTNGEKILDMLPCLYSVVDDSTNHIMAAMFKPGLDYFWSFHGLGGIAYYFNYGIFDTWKFEPEVSNSKDDLYIKRILLNQSKNIFLSINTQYHRELNRQNTFQNSVHFDKSYYLIAGAVSYKNNLPRCRPYFESDVPKKVNAIMTLSNGDMLDVDLAEVIKIDGSCKDVQAHDGKGGYRNTYLTSAKVTVKPLMEIGLLSENGDSYFLRNDNGTIKLIKV